MNSPRLTPISEEFCDVDLGDRRLQQRLVQLAEAMDAAPGASLPVQTGSEAALQGAYRFLNHPEVSAEAILEGHVKATVRRASAHEVVYVIHDTTEFRFGGNRERQDAGWLNSDRKDGFLAHASLCVAAETAEPLGSLGWMVWNRQGTRKGRHSAKKRIDDPTRESLRWQEAALQSAECLYGQTTPIHLMDREGDAYELFSWLLEHEQRFVIRISHDRRLSQVNRAEPTSEKLYASLSKTPVVLEREVMLSARGKPNGSNKATTFPARQRRSARLEVRTAVREVLSNHNAPAHFPGSLILHFVQVKEVHPPEGQLPVLWHLVTTEPMDTEEQVAAVIDAYRQRWLVEEYFKALKTGCRFQQLQMQTGQALMRALAIESAIAWRMLLMRWMAHQHPSVPACKALSPSVLTLLRALVEREQKRSLPQPLTAVQALMEVAKIGGHLKRNGNPGWLTLRRGFDKLLTIQTGWLLGQDTS